VILVILRWLLALFFIAAGANHFVSPEIYRALMPPALPGPDFLIALSGVAEIAGGVGVLIPRLRRAAGWGLIALLVAVFPANLHAAFHGLSIGDTVVPAWVLWARLPFQLVFVAWVWVCCFGVPGRSRA
jgi:uncharacterized membrane protein